MCRVVLQLLHIQYSYIQQAKATTEGLALIAFLSGNAFDADNLPNYHNDHIRGVGVSGHVMPLTRGLFTLEMLKM